MTNPYNPYGEMPEIPSMSDLTPDEQQRVGCLYGLSTLAAIGLGLIIVFIICLLTGCTATPKIVTVPEIHEHYHHTADTIRQTDSIIDRQTTLIREVDSATMARYGIQLKALQRAWLIETDRLQRQLSALQHTTTDTTVIHDTIPRPYPVEVVREAEKPLTAWQQFRLSMGNVVLITLGLLLAVWVWRTK